MLFLVELDAKPGLTSSLEAGRTFIEQIIFPTLARADQLVAEKKILAGGVVVGRIGLRFVVAADSSEEADRIISSLPIWPIAETRATPLITLAERREHLQMLLEKLAKSSQQ